MIEELDLMVALPRRGGRSDDLNPRPDDFGPQCIWCGYKWKPEETDPERQCPRCTKKTIDPPRRHVWKRERNLFRTSPEFAEKRRAAVQKGEPARAAIREAKRKALDEELARGL